MRVAARVLRSLAMQVFAATVASEASYLLGEGPVWDEARERVLWVDIVAGHGARRPSARAASSPRTPCCTSTRRRRGGPRRRRRPARRRQRERVSRARRRAAARARRARPRRQGTAGSTMAPAIRPGASWSAAWLWTAAGARSACTGSRTTAADHPGRRPRPVQRPGVVADGTRDVQRRHQPRHRLGARLRPGHRRVGRARRVRAPRARRRPDGMCVDTDGNLWVAIWGGARSAATPPPASGWPRRTCRRRTPPASPSPGPTCAPWSSPRPATSSAPSQLDAVPALGPAVHRATSAPRPARRRPWSGRETPA